MRRVILLTAMLMAVACKKDAVESRLVEEAKVGAQNPGNDDVEKTAAPSTEEKTSARSGRTSTTDHPDTARARRASRANRATMDSFGSDERAADQVIESSDGRETGVFRNKR